MLTALATDSPFDMPRENNVGYLFILIIIIKNQVSRESNEMEIDRTENPKPELQSNITPYSVAQKETSFKCEPLKLSKEEIRSELQNAKSFMPSYEFPSAVKCIYNPPQYTQRNSRCQRCGVKYVERVRNMCLVNGHHTLFEPSVHQCTI